MANSFPSGCPFQNGRPQGPNFFSKLSGHLGKTGTFGRRNPFQSDPFRINPQDFNQLLGQVKHFFGFHITIQVMTVTHVSPGHQNAVRTSLKRLENKIRIDPARTHHPNNSHVGRILKTAHPCQISGRIGAPVTRKCYDFGIKYVVHRIHSILVCRV
jgi:hypothetical protein